MNNEDSSLEKLSDTLGDLVTNIPAPVRKNFLKAFGQLCTAAVDVPIAWLQGKSAEIRGVTQVRLSIIEKQGLSIAENTTVPEAYVRKAAEKFAAKIIKEQLNLDEITAIAAKEITTGVIKPDERNEQKDISEDWLNEFELLAKLKSTDDAKLIFGKILAGEITAPGSFSIRTIRLLSQLDNDAAKLFQVLCSISVSLWMADELWDARVVALEGRADKNALLDFGLSFDKLNILQEYGLIIPDYNSSCTYDSCIINVNNVVMGTMQFQGMHFGLSRMNADSDLNLRLHGVALTKAGKELLKIIPLQPSPKYHEQLLMHFIKRGFELKPVINRSM